MAAWFPEREFVFIPRDLPPELSPAGLAETLEEDARAEWMVWDLDVDPKVRRLFDASPHRRQFISEGFLRATRAGAAPAPLYSLNLDPLAPHDCAGRASALERLLADPALAADAPLLERARRLMTALFSSTPASRARATAFYGPKTGRRILVLGHAQDARTLAAAGQRLNTNEDLLAIAAGENPGAQVLWRPAARDACVPGSGILTVGDELADGDLFETIDQVYTLLAPQAVEAICRGIRVTTLGAPFYAGWGLTDDRQPLPRRSRTLEACELFAAAFLQHPRHFDPTYKTEIDAERAIGRLIQARDGGARAAPTATPQGVPTFVIGMTSWRDYLCAWMPEREFTFVDKAVPEETFLSDWAPRILARPDAEVFLWGLKGEPRLLAFFKANAIRVRFVEDGFLRSVELGGNRTPPFSLTLDSRAPYFDARQPTDLEHLLASHDFDADPALMTRAQALMASMLRSGVSKYNHQSPVDIRSLYGPKTRPRILVLGQAEDDASITFGSDRRYSNCDAVTIAALENPQAQVIYKPHPDVMNAWRRQGSDIERVRRYCEVLERDIPLAQSLETIDHVYTITSLGGFESLMRGIPVTTLGCPFYSGWGLTDERQGNARRGRPLSVLQVFAAAYILYPRYFDPNYRMPIEPEQAVARLARLRDFTATPVADVDVAAATEPWMEHEDVLARVRQMRSELDRIVGAMEEVAS